MEPVPPLTPPNNGNGRTPNMPLVDPALIALPPSLEFFKPVSLPLMATGIFPYMGHSFHGFAYEDLLASLRTLQKHTWAHIPERVKSRSPPSPEPTPDTSIDMEEQTVISATLHDFMESREEAKMVPVSQTAPRGEHQRDQGLAHTTKDNGATDGVGTTVKSRRMAKR